MRLCWTGEPLPSVQCLQPSFSFNIEPFLLSVLSSHLPKLLTHLYSLPLLFFLFDSKIPSTHPTVFSFHCTSRI